MSDSAWVSTSSVWKIFEMPSRRISTSVPMGVAPVSRTRSLDLEVFVFVPARHVVQHDPVAGGQSFQDLDLARGGPAEPDRHPRRE